MLKKKHNCVSIIAYDSLNLSKKNDIQIQDVRLTENFACYDFVRKVNVNNRFHELSGKHISASDGTNNALIRDILMDIQQIYWSYKFNTDNPENWEDARNKLREIKCCESIVIVTEKTSTIEEQSKLCILHPFSGRVDQKPQKNQMTHFGKVFQILEAAGNRFSHSIIVTKCIHLKLWSKL